MSDMHRYHREASTPGPQHVWTAIMQAAEQAPAVGGRWVADQNKVEALLRDWGVASPERLVRQAIADKMVGLGPGGTLAFP